MAIMPCYNDQRTIENELGGKWELIDEFTMENAEPLIYDEYPDGTPLNINGYMIILSGGVSTNLNMYVVNKNNDNVYSQTVLTSTNKIYTLKNKNGNGYNNILGCRGASSTSVSNNVTASILGLSTSFESDYLQFNFDGGGTLSNVNCKVYMLRGV